LGLKNPASRWPGLATPQNQQPPVAEIFRRQELLFLKPSRPVGSCYLLRGVGQPVSARWRSDIFENLTLSNRVVFNKQRQIIEKGQN
jgi:hypothetical protein